MNIFKQKRLVIASVAYWLLLAYILAALVFWFIELQNQNLGMTHYKSLSITRNDPLYQEKLLDINRQQHLKTTQYIGEGSAFLLVILIAAIILYQAVRRQLKIQQQQQNLMMAITHELKTPIAVTKLNLETLQKHQLDPARQQQIIRSAISETNRLNTLTNNILVSAQLEAGRYLLAKDDLDLSLLAEAALADFQHRFPAISWTIRIEPGLRVVGDGLLLQILVNNLVENAIKYSPPNGAITVVLDRALGRVRILVADQGPGIAAAEKKKVFQKFYRIGSEETRTTQGTGLGLYLCKKIAADHQARISITDNERAGAGSIFVVRF